jgi:hypothetical protein
VETLAYLIDITTSQDVTLLGVDVSMYVVDDKCIPRNRYLRRVTHETFLEYGEILYANKEDEEELMREHVDTTFVSDVYNHIVRSGVDYAFERGRGKGRGPQFVLLAPYHLFHTGPIVLYGHVPNTFSHLLNLFVLVIACFPF